MADVLSVSPTLIQAYVSAAMKISRVAVGDPAMASVLARYAAAAVWRGRSHVEGLPLGTVGGLRFTHHFPLDARVRVPNLRRRRSPFLRCRQRSDFPDRRDDEWGCGASARPASIPDPGASRPADHRGGDGRAAARAGRGRTLCPYARRGSNRQRVSYPGSSSPTGPGDTPSRRHLRLQPTIVQLRRQPVRARSWRSLPARVSPTMAPDDPDVETLMGFYEPGAAAAAASKRNPAGARAHPGRSALPVSGRGGPPRSARRCRLPDQRPWNWPAACRSSCGAAFPTTRCCRWPTRGRLHRPEGAGTRSAPHAGRPALERADRQLRRPVAGSATARRMPQPLDRELRR